MVQASCRISVRRSMSGVSAGASVANSRTGRSGICMMLACPGAMLFAKLKSHFGGPDITGRQAGVAPSVDAGRRFRRWESTMTELHLDDLDQYSDTLRLRSGKCLSLR